MNPMVFLYYYHYYYYYYYYYYMWAACSSPAHPSLLRVVGGFAFDPIPPLPPLISQLVEEVFPPPFNTARSHPPAHIIVLPLLPPPPPDMAYLSSTTRG